MSRERLIRAFPPEPPSPEEYRATAQAYHGAEVMYAFDNLGADGGADYGPADYLLRDQLSGYVVESR